MEISKPLRIRHERTCGCPSNHINCLSAKEWLQHQIAVWEFYYEKRDIRDKKIHPAVFPIALPSKCINLFTHRGELVLDPFVGSGTTLLAAQDLDRNAVGFDLKKEYVDLSNNRLLETTKKTSNQIAICADALNIGDYFEEETVSLCITSPPYANLLNRKRKNKSIRGDLRDDEHYLQVQQYSDHPADLGTMNIKEYSLAIQDIFKGILPLLKPRGRCVINITDYWWKGKRIPAHIHVTNALQNAGYELRNTIIWDRRNIVNKAGIFGWPSNYITLSTTYEYILDFWRPG
ncbi:MAG: site-specific DNA-methyltransferase [Candidatus Thorarchaeota archaeon]|nr:site-specific DNA-methyltransferase [Candidatus Thorarchaeota archaeon]